MRQHLTLPLLILYVGGLVVMGHEYLYARVEDQPEYILGVISHGGADTIVAVIASAVTAFVFVSRKARRR